MEGLLSTGPTPSSFNSDGNGRSKFKDVLTMVTSVTVLKQVTEVTGMSLVIEVIIVTINWTVSGDYRTSLVRGALS